MIDINNILTQALTAAVAEATKPLLERIEKLETNCNAYEIMFRSHIERLEALENQALVTSNAVDARMSVLEQATPETPAAISAAAFVTYLDQQEWFWEKLTRKAGEAAESVVEEAISDHCNSYDHDDYDNVACAVNDANLDDMVTMDNLRDEIKQVLRDATVSIDV